LRRGYVLPEVQGGVKGVVACREGRGVKGRNAGGVPWMPRIRIQHPIRDETEDEIRHKLLDKVLDKTLDKT
jgi:hypothetical protein